MKKIIIFSIIFLIAIISTISFLKPHYSIDTIEMMNNGFDSYNNCKFLVDGRIFSALLIKIIEKMSLQYSIILLYVIGIWISCISVMYIRKLIIKYGKLEENLNIIPTIIAYVIIFNFMYIDAFQFIEFPIIALSILLYIISADIIIKKEKFYILKSVLVTIIAMFCYQGSVSAMIVTAFVLSIIKNKKLNKQLLLEMLKIGIIIITAIILNYIVSHFFGETRRLSFKIIDNFKYTFINLFFLVFNSGNHYPEYLQLVFIISLIGYGIIKKVRIDNLIYIYILSIICGAIVLIITPDLHVITVQCGRIFFSIGATIGYMLMYLYCTNSFIKLSKFINFIAVTYLVLLLIIYFQYTYFYMKGQAIDEYVIENINNIILDYEKNNDIDIKFFSFILEKDVCSINIDNLLDKKYNKIHKKMINQGMRIKEMIISKGLFKVYTNRDIEKICIEKDILKEVLKGKKIDDNNLLNRERFIFIDDTVNIIL